MLKTTLKVNDRQPLVAVEMVKSSLGTLKGKRIAILGCSFKPGTDDMRKAPSITVTGRLLRLGAHVVLYDPKAVEAARKVFGHNVEYANSVGESLADADCAIIVTEWDEFKRLKAQDFGCMKRQLVVDGRRIYSPEEFADGTELRAIGLGSRKARLPSPRSKH
jgi:UDPglucose 6-dehydrogenase